MRSTPLRFPTERTEHGSPNGDATRAPRPQGNLCHRIHAFTLVEVLAALLLMAIIIPVAMEGMSVASRVGVLGQRKAAAMRVAERVLNELIVDGQIQQASASGMISEGDTNYPWTMRSQPWSEDAMQEMTVTVTFTLQGSNHEISASTLIAPTSSTTDGVATL